MDFIKEHWDLHDFEEYEKYVILLKGDEENCKWEQRIVGTKLECFARSSTKARTVAKEIKKGNYFEFLDNIKIKTHFDSLVCAFLLNEIKDSCEYENRLFSFVETIDNWASCDTLRFSKLNKEFCFMLSQKLLKNDKLFARRVGVNIWFDLIKDEKYFDKSFYVLDNLKDEKEYYVNMSAAWLLSFCMVKNREKTIEFFYKNNTNSFIINKAISKCRDSFRISEEDKKFLLKFKIK